MRFDSKREAKLKQASFPFLMAALVVLVLAACEPVDGAVDSTDEAAQELAAQSVATPRKAEEPSQAEVVGQDFPITVEYFTPSQTEGPFYPVQKPEDVDNDLFVLEGAAGRPSGEILAFGGSLYDSTGMPVPGAVIEIWQTDDNGVYLHPGDPDSSQRDVNFQSYGEAITGEYGGFSFRTIMPGGYGSRPRHIHVKVGLDGRDLLTTQFYFSNDAEASQDRIFAGAGEEVSALIMAVEEGFDDDGNPALIGRRDIILRTELSE